MLLSTKGLNGMNLALHFSGSVAAHKNTRDQTAAGVSGTPIPPLPSGEHASR